MSDLPEDGLEQLARAVAPVFDELEADASAGPADAVNAMVERAVAARAAVGPATGLGGKILLGLAVVAVGGAGIAATSLSDGAPPTAAPVSEAPAITPALPAEAPAAQPLSRAEQLVAPAIPVEAEAEPSGKPDARRPVSPDASLDAAALLARANQSRRGGDSGSALRDYARLLERFPRSREAQSALVARGRLRLDVLGRPRQAARDFQRYVRENPRESLHREAMVGLALSWQAAGEAAKEREAWSALLSSYPTGLHGTKAKQRLEQLGEP